MRKTVKFLPATAFLILLACGPMKLSSSALGSTYNQSGVITDKSLTYRFGAWKGGSQHKDLFNHIYFEGDTVCFSFTFSKDLAGNRPQIVFINPANGKEFEPERLDIRGKTAAGFSLVGTLLEQFKRDLLMKDIPAGTDRLELPFEVSMKMNTGETIILEKLQGTCIIHFTRQ